jgi:multimeric flavodoxin WrbA
MNSNILLLNGSSRNNGDTTTVVEALQKRITITSLYLLDYKIGYYDYEFNNKDDDFHSLIDKYVLQSDTIILASPVYWYSMSAQLKTFLDRISDLLVTRKEAGRQLRGKKLLTISVNNESEEPNAYSIPYQMSADYLGMEYLGHFHVGVDNKSIMDMLNISTISEKLID